MNNATNLIERAEREAGCRWDDPNNPNAMVILMGAMAREMKQSNHAKKDDVVAGLLIMAGNQERERNENLATLLMAGLSPDDIKSIMG